MSRASDLRGNTTRDCGGSLTACRNPGRRLEGDCGGSVRFFTRRLLCLRQVVLEAFP